MSLCVAGGGGGLDAPLGGALFLAPDPLGAFAPKQKITQHCDTVCVVNHGTRSTGARKSTGVFASVQQSQAAPTERHQLRSLFTKQPQMLLHTSIFKTTNRKPCSLNTSLCLSTQFASSCCWTDLPASLLWEPRPQDRCPNLCVCQLRALRSCPGVRQPLPLRACCMGGIPILPQLPSHLRLPWSWSGPPGWTSIDPMRCRVLGALCSPATAQISFPILF